MLEIALNIGGWTPEKTFLVVGRKYLAYGGLKRKSDNVEEELERDIRCNREKRADIFVRSDGLGY